MSTYSNVSSASGASSYQSNASGISRFEQDRKRSKSKNRIELGSARPGSNTRLDQQSQYSTARTGSTQDSRTRGDFDDSRTMDEDSRRRSRDRDRRDVGRSGWDSRFGSSRFTSATFINSNYRSGYTDTGLPSNLRSRDMQYADDVYKKKKFGVVCFFRLLCTFLAILILVLLILPAIIEGNTFLNGAIGNIVGFLMTIIVTILAFILMVVWLCKAHLGNRCIKFGWRTGAIIIDTICFFMMIMMAVIQIFYAAASDKSFSSSTADALGGVTAGIGLMNACFFLVTLSLVICGFPM